jgi:hypothetical protein
MTAPNIDIDRLSDRDLTELTIRLGRQCISRGLVLHPLVVRGDDRRPIAFLVSVPPVPDAVKEAEQVAEAKKRLENPPDRYLSVEQFLATLDDDASKSIPA